MKAIAWKLYIKNEKVLYVLQVEGIDGKRKENKLLRELKNWKNYGEGYDVKGKSKMLMFKNYFESDDAWKDWARQFPYELAEVGKSGKLKPYKLGLAYIELQEKRRQRGTK